MAVQYSIIKSTSLFSNNMPTIAFNSAWPEDPELVLYKSLKTILSHAGRCSSMKTRSHECNNIKWLFCTPSNWSYQKLTKPAGVHVSVLHTVHCMLTQFTSFLSVPSTMAMPTVIIKNTLPKSQPFEFMMASSWISRISKTVALYILCKTQTLFYIVPMEENAPGHQYSRGLISCMHWSSHYAYIMHSRQACYD